MRSPDKIWIEPAWAETFARPDGDPAKVAYIPEAISQAAVAAALEAAAVIAETHQVYQAHVCAARIRALITQPQHDAIAAHGAADVAKARADHARDAALVEAASMALTIDADAFKARYEAQFNRKRYDVAGVLRGLNRALNIQAEDARNAILALRDKPAPG